jgi:hypothetical protein
MSVDDPPKPTRHRDALDKLDDRIDELGGGTASAKALLLSRDTWDCASTRTKGRRTDSQSSSQIVSDLVQHPWLR